MYARGQVNSTLLPNATAASTAVRSICSLDGLPVPDCTLPYSTSRLLPGVHTFSATYLDPVTLQVRVTRGGVFHPPPPSAPPAILPLLWASLSPGFACRLRRHALSRSASSRACPRAAQLLPSSRKGPGLAVHRQPMG